MDPSDQNTSNLNAQANISDASESVSMATASEGVDIDMDAINAAVLAAESSDQPIVTNQSTFDIEQMANSDEPTPIQVGSSNISSSSTGLEETQTGFIGGDLGNEPVDASASLRPTTPSINEEPSVELSAVDIAAKPESSEEPEEASFEGDLPDDHVPEKAANVMTAPAPKKELNKKLVIGIVAGAVAVVAIVVVALILCAR